MGLSGVSGSKGLIVLVGFRVLGVGFRSMKREAIARDV